MKYEHTPRPGIEYHPHIRQLIETQDKRAADRTVFKDRERVGAERGEIIKDAKNVTLTDFWCEKCSKDFKGVAVKQEEVDWSRNGQNIAFYKTKCFQGHWCMRLITDKSKDAFWYRSRAVHKDRGSHYADMVQPGESGFQLLYGRKNT